MDELNVILYNEKERMFVFKVRTVAAIYIYNKTN